MVPHPTIRPSNEHCRGSCFFRDPNRKAAMCLDKTLKSRMLLLFRAIFYEILFCILPTYLPNRLSKMSGFDGNPNYARLRLLRYCHTKALCLQIFEVVSLDIQPRALRFAEKHCRRGYMLQANIKSCQIKMPLRRHNS